MTGVGTAPLTLGGVHLKVGSFVSPLLLAVSLYAGQASSQERTRAAEPTKPQSAEGDSGLQLESGDGRFLMDVNVRLQFRYTWEQIGEPDTELERLSSFRIRRARLKLGGHGFQEWFKYYMEYDFPSSTLLDWRVSIERFKALSLRFGQWKVEYNRERVDSSGKQQLVDRSIVNTEFTLDRQIGVAIYGSLFPKTYASLDYTLGTFTGTGINEPENDDAHMLWLARLQWNFLGRKVKFSQSDIERTEKPTSAIAFSAATNRTDRQRFPQRKELGEPGQYRIDQLGQDFVFRYRGLYVQQEFHVKQVRDLLEGSARTARGGYVQAGFFPQTVLGFLPEPLELAGRYASVDPDIALEEDLVREFTVGANWFFAGHDNKLTADFTRLLDAGGDDESVFRVQWDVSF